jgi:hypothetical protein
LLEEPDFEFLTFRRGKSAEFVTEPPVPDPDDAVVFEMALRNLGWVTLCVDDIPERAPQ